MNKINSIRKDWSLIETLIAQDRKILDIGCGDGGLMEQLENNRNAITHGIELNRDLAANAIARGFNVVHGNAELDLSQYSNNSFDYVILSQTLQAMMKPKDILSELLRIGSKAIVSFPNFGHCRSSCGNIHERSRFRSAQALHLWLFRHQPAPTSN